MPDLIIKNGLVIDGSGSPGFYAALLVTGDSVTIHRGTFLTWRRAGSSMPRGTWFVRVLSTSIPTPG